MSSLFHIEVYLYIIAKKTSERPLISHGRRFLVQLRRVNFPQHRGPRFFPTNYGQDFAGQTYSILIGLHTVSQVQPRYGIFACVFHDLLVYFGGRRVK